MNHHSPIPYCLAKYKIGWQKKQMPLEINACKNDIHNIKKLRFMKSEQITIIFMKSEQITSLCLGTLPCRYHIT